MANRNVDEYTIVLDIPRRFRNSTAVSTAAVRPGDAKLLLGVIPLEEMDV